ncbi:hypothetical protein D3C78_1448240 [compost metagenome]
MRIEACTVEVTAGNTGCSVAILAVFNRALMQGVAAPSSAGVRPTTLISSSGWRAGSERMGMGLQRLRLQQAAL